MSTRCTTHFKYGDQLEAIIFRHTDGYPSGAGVDLRRFLIECKALDDTRLDDPSQPAARYVVFLARIFKQYSKTKSPLDFDSVRVLPEDSPDTAYRYVIDCSRIGADGLPELKCHDVRNSYKEVAIPDKQDSR